MKDERIHVHDRPTYQAPRDHIRAVKSKSRKGEKKSVKVQFDLSLDLWLKQVPHQWRGHES